MLGLIMVGVKMERLRRRLFQGYEFPISEVGGKGKDGTHEMIVDDTRHPVVITASAYQAFKTLEY
jgi:hypothetical protein